MCSPPGSPEAKEDEETNSVEAQILDMSDLSRVLAYEPSEFTISVRAGTPLAEIASRLEANGQALPFDPPWIERGSTAGGAVAAGISGPGRLRGGGVRDSVLAVRFIDGLGRHARAGAPVVKNAAGFDLPKLFTGSLGRLAILTEVTFKVLPAPRAYLTGLFRFPSPEHARRASLSLVRSGLSLDGLEIDRQEGHWRLAVRLGGDASRLEERLDRVAAQVGGDFSSLEGDGAFWRSRKDVAWAGHKALVWIPISARHMLGLEESLQDFTGAEAVYAGGLAHAWLALPGDGLPALDAVLSKLDLAGLLIRTDKNRAGAIRPPKLGRLPGEGFLRRIRQALDPDQRFLSL